MIHMVFKKLIRQPYGPNPAPVSGASTGAEGSNAMRSSFLSPTQIQQLRAQIMAYRFLARNQPVPQNIGLAVQGKRPEALQLQPQPPSGQPEQQLHPSTNQPFQRPPGSAAGILDYCGLFLFEVL